MRFLVRFRNVASMVGVDATPAIVERGLQRCREEGLENQIRFVLADACQSGLETGSADFVWGEDAWCYVADKPKLIAEAARLVRREGVIAFTDWVEGPAGLSDTEAQRFLGMMSFANVQDIQGYARLLSDNGCEVLVAEDTGRFPSHMDLYLNMIEMQLTYDVLATLGFRTDLLQTLTDGFRFLGELSRAARSRKRGSSRADAEHTGSLCGAAIMAILGRVGRSNIRPFVSEASKSDTRRGLSDWEIFDFPIRSDASRCR